MATHVVKADHRHLEKQLTDLQKALNSLDTAAADVGELILIIRRPGYTTPAELRFSELVARLATDKVRGVNAAIDGLGACVRAVGAEG